MSGNVASKAKTARRLKAAPTRRSFTAVNTDHRHLIVYVHGGGPQVPADQLKLEWDLALFGRDLGTQSRMAYWADILHAQPTQQHATQKKSPRSARASAAIPTDGLGRSEQNIFVSSLMTDLGIDESAVDKSAPRALPLPRFLRRESSRRFLDLFVGDAAAYFFRTRTRERVIERLQDQLRNVGRSQVSVIAHGLGGLVAYETLSTAAATAPGAVNALVTLGPPLGMREVQDFLVPSTLTVPRSIQQWFTFSDPGDPLSSEIARDFSSPMLVEEVIASRLSRGPGVNIGSAVSYLCHPRVRDVVADLVHVDRMARFLVARDVAERLAMEHSVREPVLIEILEFGYPALGETSAEMAAFEHREGLELATRSPSDVSGAFRFSQRIERAASMLRKVVADPLEARIDLLRHFIAARLTGRELVHVAAQHVDLRVYAIWRDGVKAKHTYRSLRAIKADLAHRTYAADGRGVTWAILDTGIQADHPHFHRSAVQMLDCTSPGAVRQIAPGRGTDRDGHGTHVAGIIGGSRHERTSGESGVAPETRLVAYKVLNDYGRGSDSWIIKALDHIAATNEERLDGMSIHGINMSLGGPYDSTSIACGQSPLCRELRRLWRAGVIVVVSVGNHHSVFADASDRKESEIDDPANLEECVAVGSINSDRAEEFGVSRFSSRGPTDDGRVKPDLVAPGESISSCDSTYRQGSREHEYKQMSGSSLSAAHVSGLLAAFLSVRREFRGHPGEVKRLLLDSCTDLGRDRSLQGRGVPNLLRMLREA